MKLYHCTTPSKVKQYEGSKAIWPPVRGWKYPRSAEAWAKKTGRSIVLEIEVEEVYPLPDHKPLGHAYWSPGYVRSWNIKQPL